MKSNIRLLAIALTLAACGTKTPLVLPPGPVKPPLLQPAAQPSAAAAGDDSAAGKPR